MKKRIFLLFTTIFLCFCLIGCGKTTPTESESKEESQIESVIGSDKESAVESTPIYSIPSLEMNLTATETSITIEITESDEGDRGKITEIKLQSKGKETVVAESVEIREFTDLYSNTEYTVTVTYVYNVGFGDEREVYSEKIKTVALTVPTVDLTYESPSEDVIAFDLTLADPSEIATLTQIKLIPDDTTKEEVVLEDLSTREFSGLEIGSYKISVTYEYDLNLGYGITQKTVFFEVRTKLNPFVIPDFIVEVEEGRDPIILQISDTQIIDASQMRSPSRLGITHQYYWGKDKLEERLLVYLRETITNVKPDLILLTGDIIYGEFDDNGSALISLINAMDSFEIPWAPVFGNHDNESKKGVDWQCQQLESSKHCLFKQRLLTGNGNYTVGIKQGDSLTRIFFMMDSNGCGNVSAESLANGHTTRTVGFGSDQVSWFLSVGEDLAEYSPDTKVSFAFHIQISMFETAYAKYGFTNSGTKDSPISIDFHPDKAEGDFGYVGRDLKGEWDTTNTVYNAMLSIGADSIFVGHEHCNSASVVYDGVRFQFSQKIGTYDRCNWLQSDGSIVGADYTVSGAEPIMGGTVSVLDSDGSIKDGYIYYASGEPIPVISVNGLTFSSGLSNESVIAIGIEQFNGENAYKCTAENQGKVFVSASLIQNASTFTFSVYVPSDSTNKLGGYGEFAIRTKPNTIEPPIDGTVDGYIDFNSSSTVEGLKLVFDQWKTYTVDVSTLGTACTEFAFVIAKGNTIYLKDITVN